MPTLVSMALRLSARARFLLVALTLGALCGGFAGDTSARTSARPANNGQPTITGTAAFGETVTGHNGSWFCDPGYRDPLTGALWAGCKYDFQWQRCNAAGAGCADIDGAAQQSYAVQALDQGATLRVGVTATNYDCNAHGVDCRYSSATAFSAVTALVPGAPPTPPPPPGDEKGAPLSMVLPVAAGSPQEGQPLTASAGDWIGLLPLGFTYQWSRCSPAGLNCVAIAGATGTSYTLTAEDVGSTLRVAVTATNAIGTAAATSEPTPVVVSVPTVRPAAMSAPTVFGRAKEGETLTAVPGSWSGSPQPTFSYDWLRCGRDGGACLPIVDASDPVYVARAADGGRTLKVVVTATNGAGAATATSPATPVIDPRGLLRLLDGRESVPASGVVLPDRLRVERVRFTSADGRRVRGTIHISDSRGYVVRGALVSVRTPRAGAVAGARTTATATDGSVSISFAVDRSKLGKGGRLVLVVGVTKRGDRAGASVAARVRFTLLLAGR